MFALMLGVFVTLGISLSTVQASDMAVKMASASAMGDSGDGGCGGCDGGGNDGAKGMACAAVCAAPVLAVVPQAFSLTLAQTLRPPMRPYPFLQGAAFSPDPYPPRSYDLG